MKADSHPAVQIVAHRGTSHEAPENTATALAWQQGADTVEVDIHLSRDERIIVIHDENTRRTTRFDEQTAAL